MESMRSANSYWLYRGVCSLMVSKKQTMSIPLPQHSPHSARPSLTQSSCLSVFLDTAARLHSMHQLAHQCYIPRGHFTDLKRAVNEIEKMRA